MATGTMLFDMAGATPADGTGTINNPPAANVLVSTGTQPANAPKATLIEWLFDAATDEHLSWAFRMPENYSSGGTLKIQVKNKSTQVGTNSFVVKSCLAAVTPGATENVDTKVFPAPDTLTITLANAQASGILVEGSLALSATALNSVVAGDEVTLFLGRDADNASDTATGDMSLVGLALEYTTT